MRLGAAHSAVQVLPAPRAAAVDEEDAPPRPCCGRGCCGTFASMAEAELADLGGLDGEPHARGQDEVLGGMSRCRT